MDNSFSLGNSRHHSHGAGNSQPYRVSPVNFGNRHSNGNGNGSPQQVFSSVSSLFGSAMLPPTIFGRGVNSSNYPSAAPNHFNFPLRSNPLNSRSSFPTTSSTVSMNAFGKHQRSNSAHGNPNHMKSRSQNQSSANNGNGSSSSKDNNGQDHQDGSKIEPQYRIFKRGDSIPGIHSPVSLVNPNQGAEGYCHDKGIRDSKSSDVESTNQTTEEKGGLHNKENTSEKNAAGSNEEIPKKGNPPNKTSVSQVNDIAKFHGLTVEYRLVGEKGPPHNPTFTVVLRLGPNEEYTGQGSSIKRAQNAAATEALEKTELMRPISRAAPKKNFGPGGKRPNWAIMQLTALADELKEPISIMQQPIAIMDPFRRGEPPSVVSIHVGERIFTGEGSNFNAAKNMAAMIALKAMLKVKQELELKKLAEAGVSDELSSENKSPISVVHEMAMKRSLTVKFEVAKEEGPPHNKTFTVVCTVGEGQDELEAEGQGSTKQAAKKSASELMIQKLNDLPLPPSAGQFSSLKSLQRGLLRQKNQRKKSSFPVVKDLEKQTVSPISRLIQIAHIRKYKEPEFNLISSTVNVDDPMLLKTLSERERRNIRKKKPTFTMEVVVGPYFCRGTGPNKRAAKKAAAEAALVELGYGPNETPKESGDNTAGAGGANLEKVATNVNQSKHTKGSPGSSKCAETSGRYANGSIVSARQIVPGVLVLKSESQDSGGGSPIKNAPELAEGIAKINSLPAPPPSRDGVEKLAYLAKLLGVNVSYSDFPKKNEFLSVVSLGMTPPHVAHGCGSTLDEAQNMAATKILEELSDIGLDCLKTSDVSSGDPNTNK